MSDLLANFFGLDELIQVIYQGFDKFVVLSSVDDSEWNIYVGLSGRNGRWWRGRWTENEFKSFFGSKLSDKVLEMSAEKLIETFVQGELFISDWSPDKGANIKLTLGPASKKPLHVALTELTPMECIEYTTSVLMDVARRASQSRKCRLHSSPSDYATTSAMSPTHIVPRSTITNRTSESPPKRKDPGELELLETSRHKPDVTTLAREAMNRRKGEDETKMQTSDSKPQAESSKPVRPKKGASLANPNKKARKYQAIEFESDDE